jgi:hypothetical protein
VMLWGTHLLSPSLIWLQRRTSLHSSKLKRETPVNLRTCPLLLLAQFKMKAMPNWTASCQTCISMSRPSLLGEFPGHLQPK